MTYDTIDSDVTMSGVERTLLGGRYRIVKQLGQGGMGSVWLAEDTQLDNKQFAIKMLPSILVSNKRAYRQLKDEALVAMKLTHPNIVTLRAFEENNGNPFLVMDYVEGQTLDDYLAEKGTLSEEEAVKLLKPIAAALDYAHTKGVVHRDVKPGNVMIAMDGTPYILAFGIARGIQETMTRVTGKMSSGTLLYMSPEQLNGDAPKPAQDIYSFAAMAYECLKGKPPFSRGNVEFQILNKIPEPPVGRDDPSAPLVDGIMAGLAKKPEDRPKTCAAVLDGENFSRVERVEDDSRARTPVAPQKEGCFSHKAYKGRSVAVVLSLLAAICLGGWFWFKNYDESVQRRTAKYEERMRELEKSRQKAEAEINANVQQEKARYETKLVQREEKEKKEYFRPKHGDVKTLTLPSGATMEMIYVGPGTFTMGSPPSEEGRDDDETQHRVTLTKGFWLGKYEVTQNQWQSVMGSNPSFFKGDANLPVENVSWDDCQEFVRKVSDAARRQFGGGARLPTEAEWEYACRAEMSGAYAGTGRLDDMGWYGDNCGDKTHPVGQKRANGWGFYDMHGNVKEWCQDWYGDYDSNATDPSGPASGDYRVLRGGSWFNLARYCRSAIRVRCLPGNRLRGYGFRLSCSALP